MLSIQQLLAQRGLRGAASASQSKDEAPRAALLGAIGTMHTAGYPVDFARVQSPPMPLVSLPSYPWQRERYWFDDDRAPAPQRAPHESAPAAPVSIGNTIITLWKGLLRAPEIGPGDSFFELGGTSLVAAQMMFELRTALQRDVPYRVLYHNPTLGAFQAAVEQLSGDAAADLTIRPTYADRYPLSFQQERALRSQLARPDDTSHSITRHLLLTGDIDEAALARSLEHLVARHDVFRLRFDDGDQGLSQRLMPASTDLLVAHDLTALAADAQQARMTELLREAEAPFDLLAAPPYRFELLRLAAERRVLSLAIHHIITDYWSYGILQRELATCYEAYRRGSEPQLPAPQTRYVDFAAWQRAYLSGDRLERALAYWADRIDGIEGVQLPFAPGRCRASTPPDCHWLDLTFDGHLAGQLARLAQITATTRRIIMLSALATLLRHYTGREALSIPVVHANRDWPQMERVVGYFAHTQLIAVDASSSLTVAEHVTRVRDAVLTAGEEQALSPLHYHFLARGDAAPFRLLFNYITASEGLRTLGAATVTPIPNVAPVPARHDVQLAILDLGDKVAGRMYYAADITRTDVEQLAARYQATLRAMVTDLRKPIDDVLTSAA